MIRKNIIFHFLLCLLLTCLIANNCNKSAQEFPKQWYIYGVEDISREKSFLILCIGYTTKKEMFYSQERRKHYFLPVSKGFYVIFNWQESQVIETFKSTLGNSKLNFHFSPNTEYIGFLGSSKYRRPEQGYNSIYLYNMIQKKLKEFVSSKDTFEMIDDWAWSPDGEWIAYEKISMPHFSELRIRGFKDKKERMPARFDRIQRVKGSGQTITKIAWIKNSILLISAKGLELYEPFHGERKILCGADSLLDFSVLPGDTEIVLLLGKKIDKNRVRINVLNVSQMTITQRLDSLEYFPYLKPLDADHILFFSYTSFAISTHKKKSIRLSGLTPFWKDKATVIFVSKDKQKLMEYNIKTEEEKEILSADMLERLLEKGKL